MVIGVLADELRKREGLCTGFVVMPDHVHAILWFPETGCLSPMIRVWKSRSSRQLKQFVRVHLHDYWQTIDPKEPFWQARYYSFNVYSEDKAREKLEYMHLNPVRAGLVKRACDWRWSSARYYEDGSSVGVPIAWFVLSSSCCKQHRRSCEEADADGKSTAQDRRCHPLIAWLF